MILPPAIRSMLTAVIRIFFPVGLMPSHSPPWVPSIRTSEMTKSPSWCWRITRIRKSG
jgi:hypothetical protein